MADFAQKLLTDLRVRKDRMASSRGTHANLDRPSTSAQKINALESAGTRSGNTSTRTTGSSRSINTADSSNQIVLYESGQNSKPVRDLSMAIALAFENSGNLTKIGSNPLVNFFNQFGRRSLHRNKMDITSFNNHSQFPDVHINEISKGVHKLNHIIRTCSNALNFDTNSMDVGKELLKGAVDLEESLRMLVNLQEGSKHSNGTQKKSRLKLLEEDDDDREDTTADEWKRDRPRFTFDKTSRKSDTDKSSQHSKVVLHSRSSSYFQDSNVSTQHSPPLMSTHEKGRLSNVIAKLMGLEEIPLKEDAVSDSKAKQGKVLRENTKLHEPLDRERRNGSLLSNDKKSSVANNRIKPKAEKTWESPDQNSEKRQLRRDLNILSGGTEPLIRPKLSNVEKNKQQSHNIVPDKVSKLPSFEESEKIQSILDNKSKMQQKTQNNETVNSKEESRNRIEHAVSENTREKRSANKDIPSNQKKSKDERLLLKEQVVERTERSEENHQTEQKGQQSQKPNVMDKNHEGHQPESVSGTRYKRSTSVNSQRKLSRDKNEPGNRRSTKPTERFHEKDPPTGSHQDVSPVNEFSHKTASDQESFKKDEPSHVSPQQEPRLDKEKESRDQLLGKEKPKEAAITQKKAIAKKVQKSEIPQKTEVLIIRRNTPVNHSTRSVKQPANMLRDLKQQMHIKNQRSRRMTEQSDSKAKEEKAGVSMNNESGISTEPVPQQEKLQNVADLSITSKSSLNDNCNSIALNLGEVSDDLKRAEQPYTCKDEQELKQSDRSIGDHDESAELHNRSQYEHKQILPPMRPEQLTEPEKDLKEIVIKSQLFLSTSEALFRLNIPISFLHIGDQDEVFAEKKLLLDCAYEVMKRKARRREVTYHPYMNTTILSHTKLTSLDDLVKQLCKDIERVKLYGENEGDIATGLYKMVHKDIYNTYPDVNTMWDLEWSNMMSVFPEKEDVIREVEKHVLNGLLEEITNDLVIITVFV